MKLFSVLLLLFLTGCGDRYSLDEKRGPDPKGIVTTHPLSLPPDYMLRAPEKTTTEKNETKNTDAVADKNETIETASEETETKEKETASEETEIKETAAEKTETSANEPEIKETSSEKTEK